MRRIKRAAAGETGRNSAKPMGSRPVQRCWCGDNTAAFLGAFVDFLHASLGVFN
jgi:hypothetical protein